MKSHILFVLLVALLGVAASKASKKIVLGSCSTMDTSVLERVARAACITSCSIQNCGTGYCEKRKGRPTCVCSRCDKGGNVPIPSGGLGSGKKG